MVTRVRTLPVSDFQGGLNLNADAFQLRENESPELLNVDLDPRGGFAMRDAYTVLNATALGAAPSNIWSFNSSDGTYQHVLVQQGSDAAYSAGSDFTAINPDAETITGIMRGCTFKDKCYVQRDAEKVAWSWNGSAATVLTDAHGAYADDFATPGSGKMPIARFICSHRNFLFHANTLESGTRQRSRVRFSHPNQPESYRALDWIDVSPGDGDEITGIVSFGDTLLIFKNKSVWALDGYSAESFALRNVTHTVGAVVQEAIAVGDEAVYFFGWPRGVWSYNGKEVIDQFDRVRPLIDDGEIPDAQQSEIRLGFLNHRLWVAVPLGAATTPSHVLVYDPRLGKYGGWTKYDIPVSSMLAWQPPGQPITYLGCHPTLGRVLKLHQQQSFDSLDGTTQKQIETIYATKWFDLGDPAVIKRWKRPTVVMDNDVTTALRVDVYKEYDPTEVKRSFTLNTLAAGAGMLWGTGVWGVDLWGFAGLGKQEIEKGGLLGRGVAVQLRFTGPTPSVRWGVNSITFRYIPKRVR